MQPKHYDSGNVTLSDVEEIKTDDLLQILPKIDELLADKVSTNEIVDSIRTVFEVMGSPPPSQAALQVFYELLDDIPKCFIKNLTTQVCKELPKTRPVPSDWVSRATDKSAALGLFKHAVRKELKQRGITIGSSTIPTHPSPNVVHLKDMH